MIQHGVSLGFTTKYTKEHEGIFISSLYFLSYLSALCGLDLM